MTSRRQKVLICLAIALIAGLSVVGLFVGVAAYGWRNAMKAGNETATIQNMETIAAIEAEYFSLHNKTFATFDQLVAEKMLSSKFVGNPSVTDGYVLTLKLNDSGMGPGPSYTLRGDPADGSSGEKHFYLDSSSPALHVNPDHEAGPNDPLLRKKG